MRGVTRVAELLEVASGKPRIANEGVPRFTWTADAPEQGNGGSEHDQKHHDKNASTERPRCLHTFQSL